MTIDTSIIISTYNSPDWLAKVLYGYNNQTYRQFEIVIADDGSKQDTFDLIENISKEVSMMSFWVSADFNFWSNFIVVVRNASYKYFL